jgi:hypothetical protein
VLELKKKWLKTTKEVEEEEEEEGGVESSLGRICEKSEKAKKAKM